MNETPSVESDPDVPGKMWALRIGAGLIGAFVLIVLMALMDREARPKLETARDLGPVVGKR